MINNYIKIRKIIFFFLNTIFILLLSLIVFNLFFLNCTKLFENQDGSKYIISGLIQDIESDSLKYYDFIVVTDDQNNRWVFKQGNSSTIGFSPSHLREHMLFGLPVTVEFYKSDKGYIVSDLYD